MEASKAPLTTTFKSKKPLLTTPNKPTTNTYVDPSAVVTPDRADPNTTARIRNKNFAFSLSDVRKKAQQLLQKPAVVGSGHPKVVPEKLRSGLAQKTKGSENPTSDKLEKLCELFNAMVSSVRLMRMKKQPPTFSKLARSVESLTDRRFTLQHLAQLKYVLPEVIVLKKVRVQDDETKCMKEEIHVSLEVDAVETDKNAKAGGGFSQLKEIFRSRIVEYYKTHENDDVPEGELPQLFHKPKDPENKAPAPLATSLIASSFKKRFSSRVLGASLPESTLSKLPSSCLSETPIKEATSSDAAEVPPSDLASTPAKCLSSTKLASTPVEFASTPARLMATTPALRTPKRTLPTSEHDTCNSPSMPAKRRSLKFDENSIDFDDSSFQIGSTISKDDVLEILPEDLLQSLKEKERKSLEEKDPITVQAKTRQKLMAGVPKLFDMIYLLFQSFGRSVITKEELIYKLVSGHLDIIDRKEIEEQLKLLQEVAPEYISEQQSLSGDTLLRLNKFSSADSIRAKLLKAK